MSRAQIASEYLFIMAFAIVIMVAYLSAALVIQQQAAKSIQEQAAEEIATNIQQELVSAAQFREGYTRVIDVPDEVRRAPVSITTRDREVVVIVGEYSSTKRTPPFQGSFTTGTNTISNTGGVVVS